MTQPPKGPGALSLLLRLSMLRSGQRGGGSLAERGYSLAVALIASFVLLLGVGALASRGQLGFIGQAFQVQNRQARDVAESAIAEFANTMNEERNRHLLIAGTTANWVSSKWTDTDGSPTDSDFRNICTVFDDDLNPNAATDAAGDAVFGSNDLPNQSAITRFTPNGPPQDLVDGDESRQFTVESIEFLNEQRNEYVDATGSFENAFFPGATGEPGVTIPYGELFRSGGSRSLIRITIVGTIERNGGRTSTARVAREFEVVPKCCKRSFGQNVFGGRNWGRDNMPCGGKGDDTSGLDGVIVGLGGSPIGGSNNEKPGIIQEDGSRLRAASCYDGPTDPSGTPIAQPSTACSGGQMSRGNIAYRPTPLDPSFPVYNHPSPTPPSSLTVDASGGTDIIYFDPSRAPVDLTNPDPDAFSGVVLKPTSGI